MGAEAQGGEKLGTGNLSLLDVIAQSIGFIGPNPKRVKAPLPYSGIRDILT